MKEGDSLFLRANSWGLIDESNAGGATALEDLVEVVNGEADVMDPRAAFGHKAANRRVRGFRFEELDQRFSGDEPGNGSTVGVIQRHLGQIENVAVERQDLFERADRYSDVRETRSATGWWHAHGASAMRERDNLIRFAVGRSPTGG